MKSAFDRPVREELVNRINSVGEESPAQWGKMNAFQMLKHCELCDEMFQGGLKIKRVFMGRLLGPMFLRKFLKGDTLLGKNAPTSPVLKTDAITGDIAQRKREWIARLDQYTQYNNPDFIHPFFGPMTKEQVGLFAYKHADHHLRQFGA